MNNLLLAIAGFICAVLVAIIFAPFFIDWNSYKAEIEAAGRRVTGQNVQIIGDVELRILPQPVFHTGGLIITNADEKKLLETNDFSLELDFPSLLRGKVEVTIMNLNDGKIFISKAEGSSLDLFNFGGSLGKPIGLEDISINKLVLNNMDIEFSNSDNASAKTLSVAEAEVTARSLEGPFKVKGKLNVNADDTVYQRDFSAAVGKYIAEKPLTVKVQVKGDQKGSRLSFLGNLVGLEKQPLLIGKLGIVGKKGENLIGYGKTLGSTLTDDLELTGDISLNYSLLDVENLKISITNAEDQSLNQGLKINGNLKYTWARKPSLNGALNIGLADFDYVKSLFLNSTNTANQPAIYQSVQELALMSRKWISDHVIVGDLQTESTSNFEGNISLNIEQISFLQNNIIDRVRLINSLINIDKGHITVPQFSAHFPGNSQLSYVLSRQQLGQNDDNLMTGQFEFTALHMRKLTNWLLFKNKDLNNIAEFWGVNDQVRSKGNVDLKQGSLHISSSLVKTRKHEFAANYTLESKVHDFEVSFKKINFDNQDISTFKSYIAPYMQAGFVAKNSAGNSNLYHILPQNIIADLGAIEVNIHSDQSFYGIRDLGVFDAKMTFNNEAATLEQLSLVGEKIFINADAKLPIIYAEKNIIDAEKNIPILNFSVIEADMNVAPQLVYDLLLDDNLFMNKIIPKGGSLVVNGQLNSANDEGDFLLNVAGDVGESEIEITAEIGLVNGKWSQQNLQYQLSNSSSASFLKQFDLDGLTTNESEDEAAILRLALQQKPENSKLKNVNFLALVGEQYIEFNGEATNGSQNNVVGTLKTHLNGIGQIASKLALFDGHFNHLNGQADIVAGLEIVNDLLHINSSSAHLLNSDLKSLKLDAIGSEKISFNASSEKLHITNLIKFFAGEHKASGEAVAEILDTASQNTVDIANEIFGGSTQALAGFDVEMLKTVEFNGKILVDKLHLSEAISLDNAEVTVRSGLGENAIFIDYKGKFLNTELAGEFILKPENNQLYMDINLQAFAVDVEQLTAGLGFDNQYLAGVVDVEVDLAGQGYSVNGLLANLSGFIDVDLNGLRTNHINSGYFNNEIISAVDEDAIDEIFINFILKNALNDAANSIKISPEKLSLKLTNGLASVAHEITFQKANVKPQKGLLSGQLDLTSNTSHFALQIPLSNDKASPKLVLEWLNVDGVNTENINFENLQEYYKVKLLEKNVQRLEELQVEIKRKNDAEIERYKQEKFEAQAFKAEIKVRVENAVKVRKIREMVAKNPPVPAFMPFTFIQGTPPKATDNIADFKIDENIVNSNLLPANIGEFVTNQIAITKANEEAARIEAEKLALETAKKAAAAAQKIVDEAPELELNLDSDDPIADFLGSESFIEEDLVDDGGGFDTGSLTDADTASSVNQTGFANADTISISPLPDIR
ncbi:MAG: AsmA family protein [Hyphomicrobiales bacterium]